MHGAAVGETRVPAFSVVPRLDILEDRLAGRASRYTIECVLRTHALVLDRRVWCGVINTVVQTIPSAR